MKKIIALAAAILLVLGFVVFNMTTVYSHFEDDGFVMPKNDIGKTITQRESLKQEDITLLSVKSKDNIIEKIGGYYTEAGNAIDLDFPILTKDQTAIRFLDQSSYLINDQFTFMPALEKSLISNQTTFDFYGQQVDEDVFIFVQMNNNLFISTVDLTITTKIKTYEIPQFSIFYFDAEFINCYQLETKSYSFLPVRGLQGATLSFLDKEMSYDEFYRAMLRVSDKIQVDRDQKEEVEEEIKEVIKKEKKPSKKAPVLVENTQEEIIDEDVVGDVIEEPEEPTVEDPTPPTPEQPRYVEPEVTISDLDAWVYSLNGNITVYDPTSRINKGVVFYVYDENGRLFLRKTVKGSGILDISILQPDHAYYIEAKYEYYNEKSMLKEKVCLSGAVIHTLPMEGNLSAVSLKYQLSDYSYPDCMTLQKMSLSNTSDYDASINTIENFRKNTLPYVNSIKIDFHDDIESLIGGGTLSNLKKGNVVKYTTAKILDPYQEYEYEIHLYDRFGNEIPLDHALSGTYKTCKETPEVDVRIKNNKMDTATLTLKLKDEQTALLGESYRFSLYENDQALSLSYEYKNQSYQGTVIEIPTGERSVDVKVEGVPFATKLNAVAIGDYNLQDGRGELNQQILGTFEFYTAGIPDGSITYNDVIKDIGGTYATIDLSIKQNSTTELVRLLTSLEYRIDATDQSYHGTLSKEMLDAISIDENYDESKGALLIQKGNASRGIPKVMLYAEKEALVTYGAWQVFLNSGINGTMSDMAGTIVIQFEKGSLTSSTLYQFDMDSFAYVNGTNYEITDFVSDDKFSTLSKDARVVYDDFFLSENIFMFFDFSVQDEDHVIKSDGFTLQLYEDGELIDSRSLEVETNYEELRFDNLKAGKQYRLQCMAKEYNPSLDEETLKENYVFEEYQFTTEEGITASIELSDFRNEYTSSFMSDAYVYEGVKKNTSFDTTSGVRSEIEQEGYFITDYLPYTNGKITVFQDFGNMDKPLLIIGFRYDAATDKYIYVNATKPSRAISYTFDKYCNSWWYNNTSITHLKVVGYSGYENKARYYQLEDSQMDRLVDLNDLEDGISPGTTGYDSPDLNRSTSDFVSCNPGETLIFQSSKTKYIYFYTKDHKYITSYGYGSGDIGAVEVPQQAAYFRYSIYALDRSKDEAFVSRVNASQTEKYIGEISWSIQDQSDDLFQLSNSNVNRYFIRKYTSDNIENIQYQQNYSHSKTITFASDGSFKEQEEVTERFEKNKAYRYDIVISYHGHDIVLDSVDFTTENKIFLLREPDDLKAIYYNSFATFIAMNDIEENASYAPVNGTFGGTIDFRGHTLTLAYPNNYFIYNLAPSGVIKNINVRYDKTLDRGFICDNYGTLQNIVYTVELESDEYVKQSFIYRNYKTGVIENFVVKVVGDAMVYHPTSTRSSVLFVRENYNVIRNGYVYDTNAGGRVYLANPNITGNANFGVLTGANGDSGVIENVYVDLNLATEEKNATPKISSGLITGSNSGRIQNVFGSARRYSFRYNAVDNVALEVTQDFYSDPLLGFRTGKVTDNQGNLNENGVIVKLKNIYLYAYGDYDKYNADYRYAKNLDITNLYDSTWYDGNINSDKQFAVKEFVEAGYYPMVNDTNGNLLMEQTYHALPAIEKTTKPVLLETIVNKEVTDYVDVTLKFSNPSSAYISSVVVKDISTASIMGQQMNGDIYEVQVRLSNPQIFVSGYQVTGFSYKTFNSTKDVTCEVNINASFYDLINSVEDFKKIRSHTNYNYRLTNDLDFKDVSKTNWNNTYYVYNFYGILDGGRYDNEGNLDSENSRYEIRNITLDSNVNSGIIMGNLTGATIKNLDFTNIKLSDNGKYNSSKGLFSSINYSELDHVHLQNVELYATQYVGSMAYSITNSVVKNCSVTNAKLYNIPYEGNTYIGGMFAQTGNVQLKNCYTTGIDIYADNPDLTKTLGFGGMTGYSYSSSRYENCYAVGKIKGLSYNGGLIGFGDPLILKCYTKVDIEADGDENGGMVATSSTSTVIEDSLSVGNFIIATENPLHTHRLLASQNYWYVNNNYGYEWQTLNQSQFKNPENSLDVPYRDDASGVLSYEQLCSEGAYTNTVRMGNSYDYSMISNGRLPWLKDTNGNLMPYQEDTFLYDGTVRIDVAEARKIEDTSTDINHFYTDIRVYHPGYDVVSVTLDGMQVNDDGIVTTVVNEGSLTKYEINSIPSMALDVYRARVKLVSKSDSNNQIEILATINYGDPVYWTIRNASEWQTLMATHGETNENFRISGTVDFSGITLLPTSVGIKVNRLEGDPLNSNPRESNVIKNLEITGNETCLVQSVVTNMSDFTFDTVAIRRSTPMNSSNQVVGCSGYMGLVIINQGTTSNMKFKDCSITGENATDPFVVGGNIVVGMLSKSSGEMKDIVIDGITILGKQKDNTVRNVYTGGLVGQITTGMGNITANNVTVEMDKGAYVGGVAGQVYKRDTNVVMCQNVNVSDMTVKGDRRVGGIIGELISMPAYEFFGKNINVEGTYSDTTNYNDSDARSSFGQYIGGFIGYHNTTLTNQNVSDQYNAENIVVKGNNYVGGIVGYGSTNNYMKVTDVNVSAHYFGGGIAGGANIIYNTTIDQSTINVSHNAAGGLGGNVARSEKSTVLECTITADAYAGGMSGIQSSYTLSTDMIYVGSSYYYSYDSGVVNSTIYAKSHHAGGYTGLEQTSHNSSTLTRCFVKNSTIKSDGDYVGGLAGEARSSTYTATYIEGGSVVGKDYVGGLVGKIQWEGSNYSGKLARSYSHTEVKGKNYVGGLFGLLSSNNVGSNSTYRHLYALTSFSNVEGTTNVYGVGYVENPDISLATIQSDYDGAVMCYNNNDTMSAKVNHSDVTPSTMSNVQRTKWNIVDLEDYSNYILHNTTILNGGYYTSPSQFNYLVMTTARLENFSVSNTKVEPLGSNNAKYTFEIAGVQQDGVYDLEIYQNANKTGNPSFTISNVTITGGKATFVIDRMSIWNKHMTFVLKQGSTEYFQSVLYNINASGYSIVPMSVDVDSSTHSYYASEVSKSITLSMPAGRSYRWYRIYNGAGYNYNTIEVTSLADGNTLTTNVAGTYYAVDETNANDRVRSSLFTYDTVVYLPLVSNGWSNVPFQNGYYLTSNGPVSNYDNDLNYQNAVVLGRAVKKDALVSIAPPSVTLPSYEVYASDADKINIEFDSSIDSISVPLKVSLKFNEGTKEYQFDTIRKSRVLTFTYAYDQDFDITLTAILSTNENGSDETVSATKRISADSLRQNISLVNQLNQNESDYYYIRNNGVSHKNGTYTGNFVHLYGNKAVSYDKKVYELGSSTTSATIQNGEFVSEVQPLYTAIVEGSTYSYFKHFMIKQEENAEPIDIMLYPCGDSLAAFDGNTKRVGTGLIIDVVAEEGQEAKNYSVHLQNGSLISTQNTIKFPEGFRNNNISELSMSIHNNNQWAMVKYNYGSVMVFNYVTGQEIMKYEPSEGVAFAAYARMFFGNLLYSFSDHSYENNYLEAKKQEDELMAIPLSDLMKIQNKMDAMEEGYLVEQENNVSQMEENDENSVEPIEENDEIAATVENKEESKKVSRNYITIFNEEKQSYEVYTVEEILYHKTKKIMSENEKIQTATQNGVELSISTPLLQQQKKITASNQSGLLVFAITTFSIAILWFVLRKKFKKV